MLSEEVRTQLEQVQQRLKLVREEVIENSISREKESFNARRAQVTSANKHAQNQVRMFQKVGGIIKARRGRYMVFNRWDKVSKRSLFP